jgi:2Fe-2S iron-sulfur cluster binding domain
MPSFAITVNGKRVSVDADADTPLLWVLRDQLGLTGTKYGCGVGICGACTVHQGGKAVRSCQVAISEANQRSFTTIEGLSPDCSHPCQRAWLAGDVAQPVGGCDGIRRCRRHLPSWSPVRASSPSALRERVRSSRSRSENWTSAALETPQAALRPHDRESVPDGAADRFRCPFRWPGVGRPHPAGPRRPGD